MRMALAPSMVMVSVESCGTPGADLQKWWILERCSLTSLASPTNPASATLSGSSTGAPLAPFPAPAWAIFCTQRVMQCEVQREAWPQGQHCYVQG